jgi:hypothetical protein
VVGLAGTAEKCAYIVDEFGFDVVIDYREEEVGRRSRRRAQTASTFASTTSVASFLDAVPPASTPWRGSRRGSFMTSRHATAGTGRHDGGQHDWQVLHANAGVVREGPGIL